MHPTVRSAIGVAILVVALAATYGRGASPLDAFGAGRDEFPAEVVAMPAPAPLAHGDRPDVRVFQLLAAMDGMWTAVFDEAGDEYERPSVVSAAQETTSGCGGRRQGWAGVYCLAEKEIVIDLGDHRLVRAARGDETADLVLAYVLAHEVGHHVQFLRGAPLVGDLETARRRELHADCLAGVWGRAAGRPLPPPEMHGEDAEHGSAAQQHHWLSVGHREARPADCDAVWTAPGL